jgi:eukaryotic-like serine/threonine-protein kinase
VPITDYCDQNRLTTHERLELFAHVCQAVQHAHHKGIIHRDIKPSNVMVTLHDEAPVVKVIDFGIAKALGQQLTDKTLYTGFAQMVGTPLYMSPEQAQLNGLDIDTRSDIYSLGVLLYELLTGTTPFDKQRLQAAGYDEMRRIIREEEPAKPSTRLSTLGAAAATVSQRRQSDPKRLSQLLRGDLDWIVIKALDKDRTRRYETVNGLARDIGRYLHDEPVSACQPSAWYRFRKFARRNRRALTTATAVTATLGLAGVALIVGTVVFIQRLQHERDAAEKAEGAKTAALVEAQAARGAAETARGTALTQVIESQTDLGLFAGEQGKLAQAALWFASAAQLARNDPERERANRIRFEAWSRENYRLVRAFQAGAGVKYLTFDASERHLLVLSKTGKLSAWELDGGTALPWLAQLQNVSAACLSPDGQTLAVVANPDCVSLYQYPDGVHTSEVDHIGSVAGALAFSSDGSLLAIGGRTGARVWDCRAKRFATPFSPLPKGVKGMVWRPHHAQILTYGDDKQARLFQVTADTKAPAFVWAHDHWQFPTFRDISVPPVFDPEGRCVLCVHGHAVECHDATSGSRLWTVGLRDAPQSLVVSPNGLYWAAGSHEFAQVYAMSDGAQLTTALPHRNHVTGIHFIDEPWSLLTVGFDRLGQSWSLPDGQPMAGEMIHQDGVDVLAKAARRDLLATAQFDGVVRIWQRPRPALTVGPFVGLAGMDSAALSADGRYVLGVSRNSSPCVVRELDTASTVGQSFAPPGAVYAAAFHPLRERVAAACLKDGRGVVQAWDWRTGISVFAPVTTPSLPASLAWAPDGKRLVVTCQGGQILLLDSERGTLVKQLQHPDKYFWYIMPAGLEFSPDGHTFVSFGLGFNATVWDSRDGQLRFPPLRHGGQCTKAHFSADGRYLVTASVDKTVRVWDVATGMLLAPPIYHPDWVFDAVFSHDGQVVASSGRDGCVRLWDWRKQALVCRVLELPDEVGQLRFTRTDRWLLTMCRNRTVRVWDARTGRPVSPPLPLGQGAGTGLWITDKRPNFTYCGIQLTPDGRRAVVGSFGVLDLTDFVDADHFAKHDTMVAWSQLLAGQVVDPDGGLVTLTSADWFERWLRLSSADRPVLPAAQTPAYEDGIRLTQNDAAFHNSLGWVLLWNKKDPNGAIAAFNEAIRLDPKYADAHKNLGDALREKKELGGAITAYKVAIGLDPSFAIAYRCLGSALREKKELDGAIAAYKDAIRLDEKNVDAYQGLGDALLDKFAIAKRRLGNARCDNEDLDGAIEAYRKAVGLDSYSALLHCLLGNALIEKKDVDGAIANYRKAIGLSPDYSLPYYCLGNALRLKKNVDGAIVAYKKAIQHDSTLAGAYYRLGNALYDKKVIDEAIVAYENAIRLDANYAAAYNGLGNALRGKKDFDGAIVKFKKAIQHDPKVAGIYNNLGTALPDPRVGLGEVLNQLDEPAAALQVLCDGAKLNPDWIDSLDTGARYNSACYAARAGTGQGKDAPPESERTLLRNKSLVAVLDAWRKKSNDANARPIVHEKMTSWLGDANLAAVRDADMLKDLPADERKAWEQLWSDVRKLRDETAPELLPLPRAAE